MKSDAVITNDLELTDIFNDHYVKSSSRCLKKSSGKKPVNLTNDTGISDDRQIVRSIVNKYKNNPSVQAIIQNPEQVLNTFSFHEIGS